MISFSSTALPFAPWSFAFISTAAFSVDCFRKFEIWLVGADTVSPSGWRLLSPFRLSHSSSLFTLCVGTRDQSVVSHCFFLPCLVIFFVLRALASLFRVVFSDSCALSFCFPSVDHVGGSFHQPWAHRVHVGAPSSFFCSRSNRPCFFFLWHCCLCVGSHDAYCSQRVSLFWVLVTSFTCFCVFFPRVLPLVGLGP